MNISTIGKLRIITLIIFISAMLIAYMLYINYLSSLSMYFLGLFSVVDAMLSLEADSALKKQRLPVTLAFISIIIPLIIIFTIKELQLYYVSVFVLGLVALGIGIRLADGNTKRKLALKQ